MNINIIASASRDCTARVRSTATAEQKLSLRHHSGRVNCVCFSDDGRHLLSGSHDATVVLCDSLSLWEAPGDRPGPHLLGTKLCLRFRFEDFGVLGVESSIFAKTLLSLYCFFALAARLFCYVSP